jgi:thymidylate synthase (FAD)
MISHPLQWQKYYPLSDKNAFICLVDHMGDDSSIVQAARVSYGKDETYFTYPDNGTGIPRPHHEQMEGFKKDRQLIRYLMNHSHTTPFEMVEIKFMVQVPMDCWRQWIRHRTASVNEYSTRYTEAIDAMQTTNEDEWRLQATDNKQGSSGYLDEDLGKLITPEEAMDLLFNMDEYQGGSRTPAGYVLSHEESLFHKMARKVYELRLKFGIAKEQARKDLPLSTYTRAYWKCDLHNIFNFLRLRMDSHAQLEIRSFANCMFEIVKQLCPVACEAFEDYILHAKKFSRMEMEYIRSIFAIQDFERDIREEAVTQHTKMTDREWKEFLAKLN